jgi:hypothetical protein
LKRAAAVGLRGGAAQIFSKGETMKIYYDKDADLSLIAARRSPSSATARKAMPTPTT